MYLQVNIMVNVIYYKRFKIVYETYESYLQTNVPKSLTTTIYLKQAICYDLGHTQQPTN